MKKGTKKPILLHTVADITKFFEGDIPDLFSMRLSHAIIEHDLRIDKDVYLEALEMQENSKHNH